MIPLNSKLYKTAIDCLEIVAEAYKLKFTIFYVPKKRWILNSGWKIKIMDKTFQNVDFIKASGEAVKFVYNAHAIKKIL